jgi:hypothetical protein
MEISVDGMGSPIDPLNSSRWNGLMQAAGEVSVRPQAWVRTLPVTFFQLRRHRFLHGHAAAQRDLEALEVEALEAGRMHQRIEQRVHAAEEREADVAQSPPRSRGNPGDS